MGIMIVPYIASLSEDAMRAVPMSMREGSYAMGSTRLYTALHVVVPAAFSGLAASYILAISRAVGETMILAVAAGMQPNLTWNPMEPAATITSFIVQVALGDLPHGSIGYQTIFAAGLTLILITLAFNILGQWLRRRYPGELLMQPTSLTTEQIRAVIAQVASSRMPSSRRWASSVWPGAARHRRLIADMVIKGSERFTLDFFLNFASRRATQAGILSAWVGSLLVMLVTALAAVPLGVAAGALSRGIRQAQLAHQHHRDQHHQPGRRAVDRLWPAGARHLRLPVRLRPEHPLGRPDPGAA
jgi:ABC-type phosphate transport system permease subunit